MRLPPLTLTPRRAHNPRPAIDKLCEKSCKTETAELAKCTARIKAKGSGSCEPWYFDLQKCIDACVR